MGASQLERAEPHGGSPVWQFSLLHTGPLAGCPHGLEEGHVCGAGPRDRCVLSPMAVHQAIEAANTPESYWFWRGRIELYAGDQA
jgi:hypothetical protein